jgi:type VI secretion system secreted protein Hcp
MRRLLGVGIVLVACVVVATTALAAETVHLYLKVNGTDVKGESTQKSLGRADSIECMQFDQEVSQTSAGGIAYGPITCVKRVDKSTPLLLQALVKRQSVDAVFKFFRPSPTGDGTTQQFFTVQIKGGRISNYRLRVRDTLVPASSNLPPVEEITFTYQSISWQYTDGGVAFEVTLPGSGSEKSAGVAGYNLQADVKDRTVSLSWSAPAVPAGKKLIGYDVYRSEEENHLVDDRHRITDFPVEKPVLTDRADRGTYYYTVQAVLTDGTKLDPAPAVAVEIR